MVGEKIKGRSGGDRAPAPVIIGHAGGAADDGRDASLSNAKISAALARLDRAHMQYISVSPITQPAASQPLAMLGEFNIANQSADRLCRARVIEQTIRQKMPAGFAQRVPAHHGMLDMVGNRRE